MKILPMLSLLFGISAVFAQEISSPPVPSAGLDWNNLSALGVLSIVVFYLLMRTIPQMYRDFREDRATQVEEHRQDRQSFTDTLNTICARHEAIHEKTAEALQALQVHCAKANK